MNSTESSVRLIVGIAGGSGAGKHRVVRDYVLPRLSWPVLILEHDWYYLELEALMAAQGVSSRLDINYDHPSAYESTLLVEHLTQLRAGHSIEVFPYRKGSGMRAEVPLRLNPAPIIIVDGIMVLSVPELVNIFDVTAYIACEDSVRLRRRVARDMAFSTIEESITRFERDVLPAHREFVEPSRRLAQVVIENSRDGAAPEGVDVLLNLIFQRLSPGR